MFIRKWWLGLSLTLAVQPIQVRAQAPDPQSQEQKIQELERKVEEIDQRERVAERTRELEAQAAADKARSGATVGAEPTGITIRSNDQNFLLKIGARHSGRQSHVSRGEQCSAHGSDSDPPRPADILRHGLQVRRLLPAPGFRPGVNGPLRRLRAAQLFLARQAAGRQVQAAGGTRAPAIG